MEMKTRIEFSGDIEYLMRWAEIVEFVTGKTGTITLGEENEYGDSGNRFVVYLSAQDRDDLMIAWRGEWNRNLTFEEVA
jgi:hypothetical protein